MMEISLVNKDRVWPSLGSDQVKLLILLAKVGAGHMNITDVENLIPDKDVLEKVVREHPFSQNLWTSIKTLKIELSIGPSESICFDTITKNAALDKYGGQWGEGE